MAYSVENVEKLIHELYHNELNQAAANQFLTLAQTSVEAWQFSWLLLDPNKPIEVQYFGASTLHLKISRCWHELDESAKLSLKSQLIERLISYLSVEGGRIVQTRLSVALAAYIIHTVGSHWDSAVPDLIAFLHPTKLTHLPSQRVLQVLIELFAIIPEELQTTHLSSHQRGITRSALLQFANQIFSIVHQVLTQQPTPALTDLYRSAIKCFANWTFNTGPLILGNVHEELLLIVLNAVCNEDLCQTAVEAILNIYSHPEIHKYPNSILQLVRNIVCLDTVLKKAIEESNVDVCSNVYNLSIQIAETHSRLLLDTIIEKPEYQDCILQLISVVLQCSSTPGYYPVDETFSELAFSFWYTLQDDIMASDVQRIETYINLFTPLFQSLIDAFLVKVQYPPDEQYENEWGSEDKESFRCYRQDIGDSLMYCYNILRMSMLSSLFNHFTCAGNQLAARFNISNGNSWQYLEAVIYALGSVAENVDVDETVFLPQVFQGLSSIPFAQISSARLLASVMDTLSSYAEWFAHHNNLIPIVLDLLILGLRSQNQMVTVSATMALKDITRECQMVISPYAEQILTPCQDLLQPESHLRPKERARLMCSVGQVLSVLPVDFIMNSMNGLLTPIITQLQNVVNEDIARNSNINEHVAALLNMLAMLFSSLDINLKRGEFSDPEAKLAACQMTFKHPQPVSFILQQVLPLLANIGFRWSTDELITEAICDCIKKAITTLLEEMKPLVNDILQLFIHLYSTSPQPSILDISKQFILLFGKDPDLQMSFMNYHVQICNQTLLICQQDIRQQTSLLEMFYSIETNILKKVPQFYNYNLLDVSSLFRFAITALVLPEKPTIRAISSFLTEFINHSRDIENMVKVVNADGENLVGQLLGIIGGSFDSPRNVVEHSADILMALNQKYFDNFCRWMNTYVQKENFPTAKISREQKEHFVRLILKERKNKRKLKDIVNEFSLTCRGLIGTEYGNQPIKLPF